MQRNMMSKDKERFTKQLKKKKDKKEDEPVQTDKVTQSEKEGDKEISEQEMEKTI